MNRRKKRGGILILMGIFMLFSAVGLHISQVKQDALAGENARVLLEQLELSRVSVQVEQPEPAADTADAEMSAEDYLGYSMIGTVRISAVGIELPVLTSWSYALLNVAPCRYSGSVDSGDLILMGHNYRSHFSALHQISLGTEVEFEDVNGVSHWYVVDQIEHLHKSEAERLPSEHELILFTCTTGGQNRIVVRCSQKETL